MGRGKQSAGAAGAAPDKTVPGLSLGRRGEAIFICSENAFGGTGVPPVRRRLKPAATKDLRGFECSFRT
jgi:hypothetical protein